jgi:hypothetical protein
VLADAGLEPYSPIAEPACLVFEGAEDPAGKARASLLRHDVHSPDLGRLRVETAHASAGDIRAVQGADEEDAVRQLEVGRGWLAPGSGPAVALQELCGERRRERARPVATVGLALYLDPARVPFRPAVTIIDRPLGLSELLAEAVRLYGHRFWAAIGLGVPTGVAFLAGLATPVAFDVVMVAIAVTGSYAAAARITVGDPFREAWAQVALRIPVLAVLTVVVSVPFAIALTQLYLLIPAAAWLGVMGFSIPVAMLERDPDARNWFQRVGFTLLRSLSLARVETLHAVGIVAALMLVYIVVGLVLASALIGFADNGREIAVAIAQVIISPLFFLGLSLLYFEQNARALSSPPKPKT